MSRPGSQFFPLKTVYPKDLFQQINENVTNESGKKFTLILCRSQSKRDLVFSRFQADKDLKAKVKRSADCQLEFMGTRKEFLKAIPQCGFAESEANFDEVPKTAELSPR